MATEFLLGGQGPNLDRWDDADFERLDKMDARTVGMLWIPGAKHRRETYDRLERILDKPVYSIRVGRSAVISPSEWFADAAEALAEVQPIAFAEGRVRLRCLNEVNLPAEGGWSGEAYAIFLYSCARRVRERWPGLPLVCAPISLGLEGWQTWWSDFVEACRGVIPADRLAVNVYAHLVGSAQMFTEFGLPVDVTEIGTLDLPPGAARGRWIVDRARELAAEGIESALQFIVGGKSNGAWSDGYLMNDEEAEAIGQRQAIEIAAAPKPPEVVMPTNPTRAEAEAFARAAIAEHGRGFPADVFVRQIDQESGFRQYDDAGNVLTSSAGAEGIGQFMPQFWSEEIRRDWRKGLTAAATWMGEMFAEHRNIVLPLVGYNGGTGAIQRYRAGEPIGESVAYVDAIVGDATIAQFGPILPDAGFPAEMVASACAPIALSGQMYGLGIPGDVVGVLQLARDYGWTEDGGMNGVENFQRMAGACWVGEQHLSTEDVADVLWSGRFVVISTPHHYYLAQRPSRTDDDLYVGQTGLARIDGAKWMSLARIIELDGSVNGIFVGEDARGKPQLTPVPEPAETVDELTDALNNIEDLTLTPGPHDEARRISAQQAIDVIKKHLEAA